jgi:hypothetical protein
MTDRELVEAAAKAAGYTLEEHFDANGLYWPWCLELEDNWCPLTDDVDAFRLAVKLKITPHIDGNLTDAESAAGFSTEPHFDDPYAATRRAIVRAAAEIGRSKE